MNFNIEPSINNALIIINNKKLNMNEINKITSETDSIVLFDTIKIR